MPSLTIIGAGQVGQALGFLFVQKLGFTLQQVLNRSLASGHKAADFISGENTTANSKAVSDYASLLPADIYLVTVSDQQIVPVAAALAETNCISPGTIVMHCSGALSSEALDILKSQGARVASMHPVKSFIDPGISVETFAGTYCALEGDTSACEELSAWLQALGAVSFLIQKEQKLLYHTALVMASNYLVSLTEVALQTLSHIGLERELSMKMLEPLMQNTLRQIMLKGTSNALSGPIARGDAEVVNSQHQALVELDAEKAELYELLGDVALRLLYAKNM